MRKLLVITLGPVLLALPAATEMPRGSIGPTRGRRLAKLREIAAGRSGMERVMTDPASNPLDVTDQAILDQVRALHSRLDPPPPDLDERVRFVSALENVHIEVARLARRRDGGGRGAGWSPA